MEKTKIQFKPLHEGMGFHPFSDGLPYAPTRNSTPTAGATSAGTPRLAPQGLKTARQLQQPTPQVIRTRVVPTPKLETQPEGDVRRMRVFAYLLDTVLHAGFWISINLTGLLLFHFQIETGILEEQLGQVLFFFMISQWIFISLQEVLFETSMGKAFFGLEFKRNHKSLFLRSVVFMVGLLAFGLGLKSLPQDRWGEVRAKPRPLSP